MTSEVEAMPSTRAVAIAKLNLKGDLQLRDRQICAALSAIHFMWAHYARDPAGTIALFVGKAVILFDHDVRLVAARGREGPSRRRVRAGLLVYQCRGFLVCRLYRTRPPDRASAQNRQVQTKPK
jgi:hypothetical protein